MTETVSATLRVIAAAPVARATTISSSPELDDRPLEPRLEPDRAQVVQQILSLVLEAQHADRRALADVGERHTRRRARRPGSGDRAGRCVASPIAASMRSSSTGRHRVLEPLGLLVDLVPGDSEHVGQEALDQAVATDDLLRLALAVWGEARSPCRRRA